MDLENKDAVICWWSGGITSAVACKIAIDIYGKSRCRVIFIDTKNEDEDTYRFKEDCSRWYEVPIETITALKTGTKEVDETVIDLGKDFRSIYDVWRQYNSLNVATGAICSSILKRKAREEWQKDNSYAHQVFGFEFDKKEMNRAIALNKNHPTAKGIFPLLMLGYTKEDCIKIVQDVGLVVPRTYSLGFKNNNCFNTGCIQGGIGYWKKIQKEYPSKFDAMAELEHELTNKKGAPVTMLKDQSKEAKEKAKEIKWKQFVFLKPHPDYPELKSLDDMKGRPVEPLKECNGFCGVNDLLPRISTEQEINFNEE